MKIKRLEIKGFKSFPDKTVLEFKPGVTAIVGPNGCGKSNVLEAIRWVMGEQRVRSLRSRKMEDVIFNGSDTRKPVGMAEVRLVLSGAGGDLPPAMAEYDEIMIARRLFRDGESQYEINNVPCRLQDVTDFFLDTGVGKNSYAIIEQGRVDMIVASKPEDRRVLIEEAAGINRYKIRREAAIRKLDQTQQNLLRLSDVINEVKRQSASLKRQASRAKRYRKLSDRLRELEIAYHSHRCARLTEQHADCKSRFDKIRSTLMEQEARHSSLHADLEKERLRALQAERELKEQLEERHRLEIELTSIRAAIERNEAAANQLDKFGEQARGDLESLDAKLKAARDSLAQLETAGATGVRELETVEMELRKAADTLKERQRELTEGTDLRDRLNEEIFGALQSAAQERNRKEGLKKRRTDIHTRLERIRAEEKELSIRLEEDRKQKVELENNSKEITRLREESKQREQALLDRRKSTEDRIRSLRAKLGECEKELAGSRARLDSLEEMQESYSGYEEGVRFLMAEARSGGHNGLLGPLAELMDVPPEFEKALTAALGQRLGCLVVTSPRRGAEAAERLKQAAAGRSTFLPVAPRRLSEPDPGSVPPGLVSLKDVVTLRDDIKGLGDFLLGRCYVVEDIQEAIEIWESNGCHIDLVTREGETLSSSGEITGGSSEKTEGEVFEQKRRIRDLRGRVATLESELHTLSDSLQQEEQAAAEISNDMEKLRNESSRLDVAHAGLVKDRENLANRMAGSERRMGVLAMERERLKREEESLVGQESETDDRLARLKTRIDEMQKQKEEAAANVERLGASLSQETARVNELKVKVARLKERRAALERELAAAAQAADQIRAQRDSLAREMEAKSIERQRLVEEIGLAKARESELMISHEEHSLRVRGLEEEASSSADTVKRLEEESAALEKGLAELRRDAHSLEMETVRLEQTLAGIVEKIVDRYGIDPTTVQPPGEPPDQAEIAELKTKLDSMGEVNLAAISESGQTEKRLHFLQEQEQDLKKAVGSLYATINKINETTRERFKAAFDGINAQFQEIFPFLFRGGEARLQLTDEDNLLESGVEIMARPPGKRIRNMDLLSGGEKALTAVALIFAIFLTKPSPFCLLDEVDAPLDDSNILRFNEMLKKLSDRTQFLVITHNKRSMETADTLYGVTMEDPGTSSIVSVEFIQ